jgi:hypothetical protein
MLGICGYTAVVAIRIEQLNAATDYYLPRKDRRPDGTLADGKWRMSRIDSPNNRLRAMVESYGLAQYIFAPLLFFLGLFQFANVKSCGRQATAVACAIVGAAAFLLAMYRGYFSSLGS